MNKDDIIELHRLVISYQKTMNIKMLLTLNHICDMNQEEYLRNF